MNLLSKTLAKKSRFQLRMDLRRAAGEKPNSKAAVLIEKDSQNLFDFEANLDAVTVLLQKEVKAISKGQLDRVSDFYAEKSELLKRIELKLPVVRPFLEDQFATRPDFKEKIIALKAVVEEDGELLGRMSAATSSIVQEIEKIQDRHSLNGSYEKTGKKVGNATSARMKIDKKI